MAKFKDVNFEDQGASFRVSFSGGKDSTAMLIMLLEKGYPVTSIDFLDTEYEYPEVYQFIDEVDNYVKRYGKSVSHIYLKDKWKFEKWFYGKVTRGVHEGEMRGYPKVLQPCYLSRQKARTLDRYDRSSYRYIGIGANESVRETNNPRLLYPLIEWGVTEDECVEYLKEINLLPTHKKYYTRSGCWFCPKQSIPSSISLYIKHPELWEQVKVWEKESPHGWKLGNRDTGGLEEKVKQGLLNGEIDLSYYLGDIGEDEIKEVYNRLTT